MSASSHYIDMICTLMKEQPQYVHWDRFRSNAKNYDLIDMERSRALSMKYRCKIKQCFDNALYVAAGENLRYVVGYATSIIPVEHAWCIDDAGIVVDPTWCLLDRYVVPDYFGVVIPLKVAWNYKSEEPVWVQYLESLCHENL